MKVNILGETMNKIIDIGNKSKINEIFSIKEVEKTILDHLSIGLLIIVLESNPNYLLKFSLNSTIFLIIEELGFITKDQINTSNKTIPFEIILLRYFIIFAERMISSISLPTQENISDIYHQIMKHFIYIEILFRSIQLFNNNCDPIINYLARKLTLKKDQSKRNRELNIVIENILQKLLNLDQSQASLQIFSQNNIDIFMRSLWKTIDPQLREILSIEANKIQNLDDIHSIFRYIIYIYIYIDQQSAA